MEWNWTVFVAVFVANAAYVAFMRMLQDVDKSLPPRDSCVPGTVQWFLYAQDFHTMTWGDLLGVPLFLNAYIMLDLSGAIGPWQKMIFFAVALVDANGFALMCLGKNHKPDMGFPAIGKISMIGVAHLPYHGIGVTSAVFVIWHIFAGNVYGPVLYVALAGGAIYIASFVADIKAGNFDPLRIVPLTPCPMCQGATALQGPIRYCVKCGNNSGL